MRQLSRLQFFLVLFIGFSLVVSPVSAATRGIYVYDWAGILTSEQEETINQFCLSVDENTTAEIVVVSLANLDDYGGDINQARETIFNDVSLGGVTGIGKAGKDNGVLVVVAMSEREWGIEVGYGLEGDLTDSESGRIGRDIIAANFGDENYFDGLYEAVQTIAVEIGYTGHIDVSDDSWPIEEWLPWIIIIGFAAIAIISFVLSRYRRTSGGWGGSTYRGGGGGGGRGGGGGGGRSGGGGARGKW
jgi:uncharacterized protein